MKHDRLKPILEAICVACDYGDNTSMKADELWGQLFPINPTMNNKHSEIAVYAIIHTALEIAKEYECINANYVDESSKENQDLQTIESHVNQQKKK